jgi:hypothetical protein
MKTLLNTLIVTFLFVSFSSLASTPAEETDRMIPPKYKNLFVFKADKKFLGAKVEILTSAGEVITSQNLEKRKVIIDFGTARFGTYTIRVSKGDDTKEFHFVKK